MGNFIKIAYFPSTAPRELVLGSNGKNIGNYCTSFITDETTGNYLLDATFTLEASEYLEEENILKVRLDYGYEIFRISKVIKGLRYIDVVARQITISDTLTMWLDDVRPTELNGQEALEWINKNSNSRKKEIMFKSDITNISTAYYQDMNVYSAISDCDQSFINRWGGEILRRGYTLSILKRVGKESGVTIREGKNLIGFSGESSTDQLITRAVGKGFNGIKGDYIESPLINNYVGIYNAVIDYPDIMIKTDETTTPQEGILYFDTEEEAKEELNNRIKKKFEDEQIDRVKATYTINFVELEKAKQYKDYSHAEKVNIGDTIRVYVPKVKTDIKVRVIGKKYDVLAQKTTEITVSNEVIITNITMNSIISELEKVKASTGNPVGDYIKELQKAGLSNSYVVFRENEILLMDTKDINTAKNIVKLNNQGLFFGNDGYYGKFDDGFSILGIINADHIRTGILTAITIQNANGSLKMDLTSNDGLIFSTTKSGEMYPSIRIKENHVDLYNYSKGNRDIIGTIASLIGKTNQAPQMGLCHDKTSFIRIGYTDKDITMDDEKWEVTGYMDFDKFNNNNNGADICPIKVNKNMALTSGNDLYFYVDDNSVAKGKEYISTSDILCIGGKNGINLGILGDDGNITNIVEITSSGVNINGELTVNGTKVYAGTGGNHGVGGGSEMQQAVVNSARKLIGKPYRWGGNYPPLGSDDGTDCSGLMQWAYNDNGITISRTTYTQITEGVEVSEADLQLGDLVFPRGNGDNGHVYMYSGELDGQHMCVEAPHTGAVICERAFTWDSNFRARRIITS